MSMSDLNEQEAEADAGNDNDNDAEYVDFDSQYWNKVMVFEK